MRNSNTSHDGQVEQRGSPEQLAIALVGQFAKLSHYLLMALFAAICIANTAYAIDPNLSVSMYIRDQWRTEKGFPGGPVYAIAQTADGYLWIGTEKGLVRFDGLNFSLIQPSNASCQHPGRPG